MRVWVTEHRGWRDHVWLLVVYVTSPRMKHMWHFSVLHWKNFVSNILISPCSKWCATYVVFTQPWLSNGMCEWFALGWKSRALVMISKFIYYYLVSNVLPLMLRLDHLFAMLYLWCWYCACSYYLLLLLATNLLDFLNCRS